jgi:hypothetical protein
MGQRVTDAAAAAKKFTMRGQAAASDYRDGVAAAGSDWAQNTAASEDNYNAGVQDAISRKAFSKGVAKTGAQGYVDRATTVGAQRFPQGIAAAGPAWQDGAQPYLDVARNTNLTPRGPKGSPQNMQRAADMAAAMRRKKVGG